MKIAAYSRLLFLFISLGMCAPAYASHALHFDGGGYWLDMSVVDGGVGGIEQATIGSIDFHALGANDSVLLAHGVSVASFDFERKELVLSYSGLDPRVPPFRLSVKGDIATLEIEGQRIQSRFIWLM